MPSLKAIRNRIRSVKSTQQITRAMKMVAAARLRRAQEAVVAARPYSKQMRKVLDGVAQRVDLSSHPLMQTRPVRRVELVVLTGDRGLCGGFNANVIRRVQRWQVENEDAIESLELSTIGRKGYDFFRRRGANIRQNHAGLLGRLAFDEAETIAEELTQRFIGGEVDAVYLAYNELVSAVTQRVTLAPLLPIVPPGGAHRPAVAPTEYLYEPNRDAVLETLLPRYLANMMWQALLESVAAEQAARMSAMDSATNNAADMIARLTLQYNRTRQAAITKELMEVVSGAEALT